MGPPLVASVSSRLTPTPAHQKDYCFPCNHGSKQPANTNTNTALEPETNHPSLALRSEAAAGLAQISIAFICRDNQTRHPASGKSDLEGDPATRFLSIRFHPGEPKWEMQGFGFHSIPFHKRVVISKETDSRAGGYASG